VYSYCTVAVPGVDARAFRAARAGTHFYEAPSAEAYFSLLPPHAGRARMRHVEEVATGGRQARRTSRLRHGSTACPSAQCGLIRSFMNCLPLFATSATSAFWLFSCHLWPLPEARPSSAQQE